MASTFSSDREKYIGFAESAAGVGLMIGPVIGGVLNSYMGYLPCYLVFASILFLTGIACLIMLPGSLNQKPVRSDN